MPTPLKKILCIDDEEDILGVIKFALENVGHFTVETCQGGKNAITAAQQFQPDVILLDVMMPEQDGPTTLKMLRQAPVLAKTPVIFMTAKVQSAEIKEYLAMGVCGVVPKPFDPMTVSREVEEHWAKFQSANG